MAPARIVMLCEGDAESYDKAFSGSAKSLLDHLRGLGHPVSTVDVRLPKLGRLLVAARCFSSNRAAWKARFRRGPQGFAGRSRRAERAMTRVGVEVDVLFQIGASFRPPGGGRWPYVLYCDWNAALSIREKQRVHSAVHHLSPDEAQRFNDREAEVYRGAEIVFTFSDKLRESFVRDYRLPPERVVTVHAGPNIDLARFPTALPESRPDHRPTVLFIGKEFERKGGDVLRAAFRKVRETIPAARLIIMGPSELALADPGVEVRGFVRKDAPGGLEALLATYREADVFCLPSRHDPFPTVVREAMFFHLPCVTTDIWALPEMVVDGQTGFTVPVGDADALAARLILLLNDTALRRRLGQAGRARAEERFTWTATARAMSERIQAITRDRSGSAPADTRAR
jgi:glycosyltransferase involved in cell wall biosynthesis